MESPNMYDQQQLHQVDLKPKIMSPTSSTPVPTNANSNGNNSSNGNNNNNSNMQVNHNQQQQLVNGVSKVAASKATVHQQYAEHCAAAGELTDLNNPEMTLDLQQLIDESSPFVNDAGILEILGNGLKHHQRPQPHTANQSYNPRSTLAYMPQPVHSAAGYQPPHHHQQQHHPNSSSANNNNSCSDSNSSCSESPSIKEEPVDATDFRRHCQQQQQQGYAQVQYPAFQQFAQALPPLHQTANPHLQQIQQQQQHNQQGRPGGQKPGAGLVGAVQQVARKHSKSVDKASDEYRRRRERNNIAVRKSREKAKVRTRETEERVKILMKDNDSLRKKVVELNEEVSVLKSLFHNVGMLPEQLQRELSRHLDQFQTHGQAI